MFLYTDAVTVMLDMLMHVNDLTTAPELIALAVNLTQNERIAQVCSICLHTHVHNLYCCSALAEETEGVKHKIGTCWGLQSNLSAVRVMCTLNHLIYVLSGLLRRFQVLFVFSHQA